MESKLDSKLGFGKYRGRTWREVAEREPGYLRKLAGNQRTRRERRQLAKWALREIEKREADSEEAASTSPPPRPVRPAPSPAPAGELEGELFHVRLRPLPKDSPSTVRSRAINWRGQTVKLSQQNRAGQPHDPSLELTLKTRDADLAYYLLAQVEEYEAVSG